MVKPKKVKKIPMRMCAGCRTRLPKKELSRLVYTQDEGLIFDKTGKLPGRGAYLCPNNVACLDKAIKTKFFERNLEINVSTEDFNRLKEEIGIDG